MKDSISESLRSLIRNVCFFIVLGTVTYACFYKGKQEKIVETGKVHGLSLYTPAGTRVNLGETASEGYLCRTGHYGRLNNILDETLNALFVAKLLNRTLIPGKQIGRVYDISQWQSLSTGKISDLVAKDGSKRRKKCKHTKAQIDLSKILIALEDRTRTSEILESIVKSLEGKRYVSLDATALFRFRPGNFVDWSFRRKFYSVLKPVAAIEEDSVNFVKASFIGKSYISIHLRNLETSCIFRMYDSWLVERFGINISNLDSSFFINMAKENQMKYHQTDYLANSLEQMCSIAAYTFERILNETILNEGKDVLDLLTYDEYFDEKLSLIVKKINVFVLSDGQLPETEQTYFRNPKQIFMPSAQTDFAVELIYHKFEEDCAELCPLIDFEIATMSNLFIGNYASSASRNVAAMRNYRLGNPLQHQIMFPNILYHHDGLNLSVHLESESWL